tara:strand:+ start:316 stop:498 length:183 start_codon:yes stop_codon:yes gene_type:complete
MISEATEKDWDDFWKSEGVVNSYSEYFEDVWWEMESIEPLTPVTKPKENLKFIDNVKHSC